ncbi:glycine zipper family protein [Flavobacterium pedocola]
MKKLVVLGMLFMTILSCKDMQKENEAETAKQAAIDSMKMEMEKQRIIDSVKIAESNKKEVVVVNNGSQAPQRKKMSGAAKGALIGAGVGAVTGAAVSDKKAEGAIIGAAAGAGVGAGTGAIIDEKKKK